MLAFFEYLHLLRMTERVIANAALLLLGQTRIPIVRNDGLNLFLAETLRDMPHFFA